MSREINTSRIFQPHGGAALFAALMLAACQRPAIESSTAQNGAKVEKLFEHEGCTAYRFDDARTVYYVRCSAETSTSYSYSCGKNCTRSDLIVTENRQ